MYNKDNEVVKTSKEIQMEKINQEKADQKRALQRKNIPAYIIAGFIIAAGLIGSVCYLSEKLSDYIDVNFIQAGIYQEKLTK